jgi:predicted nucleic acid-binding protein
VVRGRAPVVAAHHRRSRSLSAGCARSRTCGEAACLALAIEKGWSIASDERRRFRREAEARIGKDRILGTADLFVLAIQTGVLTVQEADADKLRLEQQRFRMPFGSFRDLLQEP